MIREAISADAAAGAAIYAPYITDTVISFEGRPPSATEMQRRMRSAHVWLVAEVTGQLRGHAYASAHREREAYRWAADVAVYLDPAHHGRGLGRTPYADLIERLRERGACVLYAGVALPNAAGEALHKAMGFTEVGTHRRIAFKLDRWIDTRRRVRERLLEELDHLLRRPGRRAITAARAADAIRARTPWRWVGIYTVADGSVTNQAWSGPEPPAHAAFPATEGLTSTALVAPKTIIATDVAAEPGHLAKQDKTRSEMIYRSSSTTGPSERLTSRARSLARSVRRPASGRGVRRTAPGSMASTTRHRITGALMVADRKLVFHNSSGHAPFPREYRRAISCLSVRRPDDRCGTPGVGGGNPTRLTRC